jgi:hypothetical protein
MQIKRKVWFMSGLLVLVSVLFVYRYMLMNLVFIRSVNCGQSIMLEATSPDGKYIATVFERNCGAVTPFVRVVSIRRRESQFNGDDVRTWVFVTKDQPTIQIRWFGEKQLNVGTEGYSRTPTDQRLKMAHWENVEIVQGQP